MDMQQVIHELALEYAKAQYSEYQRMAPSEKRNNLNDPYQFFEFYASAYDILDPQRDRLQSLIGQEV